MRLLLPQVENIQRLVANYLGADCTTYLFGSRLDDHARGGDVDLLVETTHAVPRLVKARLKDALEHHLKLPVDLIVECRTNPASSFVSMIRTEAVSLKEGNKYEFKSH